MGQHTRCLQIYDIPIIIIIFFHVITFTTCAETKHVYTIPEEQRPGTLIGNVPQDTGLNSIISDDDLNNLRYSFLIQDDPHIDLFSLDERSGDLSTSVDPHKSLDRETICRFTPSCVFVIEVAIKSILNQFFRTVELQIILEDINDNKPTFVTNETTIEISESVSLNTTILITGARDRDSGSFSIQKYKLESSDDSFGIVFSTKVDGTSEVNIFTKRELDYEKRQSYALKLIAVDGGKPPLQGTMIVNVKLIDVNDNKPKFFPLAYNITVEENVKPNSSILTVTATDADSGDNGDIVYGLSQHQSFKILKLFSINSESGDLLVVNDLQKEEDEKYEIIVEASDRGAKPYTTQTMITVNVLDTVNDPPKIRVNLLSSRNFSLVSENANIGTVVAHIAVHDADRGRNGIAHCQLSTHKYFELQGFDLNEYKVIVAKPLNHELKAVHSITVTCHDAGNPPLSATAIFDVRVSDENDNPPRFSQSIYSVSIPENNNIGDTIMTLTATDSDEGENGKIEYTILSYNGSQFLIVPDTGEIKANTIFDFESQRSWKITVKASDKGTPKLSSTARVVVQILDTNDEKPKLTRSVYKFDVPENVQPGRSVGSVNAFDFEAGDNGKVVISLGEKNTNISPFYLFENGSVVVQGSLDYEMKSAYKFSVIATDRGVPPLSSTALVEISVLDENDNVPVITFPNSTHYSANVSISDKPDKVVSRVEAYDNDSGPNAELKYVIGSRNDSQRFTINQYTGEISMARFLEDNDIGIYKLMLSVQDRGLRPLVSHALLIVHVLPGNGTRGDASAANEQNVLITVSLICLTAIISAVIVLVIIVMRRNDRKRRGTHETPVYLANTTTGYMDKSISGGLVSDKDGKQQRSNDDGEFGFVLNGRNNNNMGQTMGHKETQNQDDVKPDYKTIGSSGKDSKQDQFASLQNQPTVTQPYQDVTLFGQRSEAWPGYQDDQQSDGSGDTATSDSGRGGSEEDSNEFHETSRESNQNSLKSGLKDPIGSSSRKHVTFKDPSEKWKYQHRIDVPNIAVQYPPSPSHWKQLPNEYRTSSPVGSTASCPTLLSSFSVGQCKSPEARISPQINSRYYNPEDRLAPASYSPYPEDFHDDSIDNDDDRSTTTSGSYTVDVDAHCLYLDGNEYTNVVV